MIKKYKEFAEFILLNLKNKESKIIEVGIGKEHSVYNELKKLKANIIAVDIDISSDEFIKDDITKPNMSVYEKGEIIYSIRPPPELYPFLKEIARKVKALLIIKPLATDEPPEFKLVNYKGLYFYIIDFRC